ncbi:unnamed protein product [Prunus armeniaca]|uniref:DDE Tnp4 domain-containing protein n=1 Tax=Prunus armeniaca TaxID=36596 RepID=A0A6J5XM81_PRUAR|nr:unnamed protein product [Prunus armeniaca]
MSNNMDKPSQDECGEKSKKQGKAHWDDEALDAFIKICVVETIAGNQPGGHDARIFMEALRRPILKFPHPPTGKYYLVDAGYPQIKGYLGPYRDQEFQPYDDDDELLPYGGAGVTIGEEMVEEQNLTNGCEMADERERIANLLISG